MAVTSQENLWTCSGDSDTQNSLPARKTIQQNNIPITVPIQALDNFNKAITVTKHLKPTIYSRIFYASVKFNIFYGCGFTLSGHCYLTGQITVRVYYRRCTQVTYFMNIVLV